MPDIHALLADLHAESDELDGMVAELDEQGWTLPTPAPGWTIAHQIAHLNWTDDLAVLAATDPDAFTGLVQRALDAPGRFVDDGAAEGARLPPGELLRRWRAGRARLAECLATLPAGTRLVWMGPPMSAASMATARLMETWAHGLDVADALGVTRRPTGRLHHIAWLAVRTRDFAFRARGKAAPDAPFRIELTAPDGSLWTFGSPEAEQSVTGPALDLCLLATQRRHRSDLALTAVGPDADAWLDLAQAFAGPPGTGRPETGRPERNAAG
ncbi:MAG TPA: TIGR03084 family metal-binding protein [Jatrophihabitans sp.]|jgi:uncharacterized protein (TIGR03084 family)|nr:TIGR03084 family metal-binding protein [Jatrophihabitans sp.]